MKQYTSQTIKEIFGKNIKYYRYQKNLSQEKLSELTKTDLAFISEIECGKIGVSFEKIVIFANVLGVPLYQLFEETNLEQKLPRTFKEYKKENSNKQELQKNI